MARAIAARVHLEGKRAQIERMGLELPLEHRPRIGTDPYYPCHIPAPSRAPRRASLDEKQIQEVG
jgi:hypothetical protein